jgi:hypothetical protein
VTGSAETHQSIIPKTSSQAKRRTSSRSSKRRPGQDSEVEQEDVADHRGDCGDNGQVLAHLEVILVERSEVCECERTVSGEIEDTLEVVENDLLDGVDEVADSELFDQSPEILRGAILFRLRELGVGHDC